MHDNSKINKIETNEELKLICNLQEKYHQAILQSAKKTT
jgi:hypothetical protein